LPSEYDEGRSQLVDAERFRERFEAENGQDRPLGDLRVKLRQLITLRGVVLGVDGKPAPGATVYFRHLEARADSLLLTPHVTAGPDGAFEIPRLRYQDGVFLLRARKGSLATTEDVKFDVREEPGPQTLTLAERPLALLRGRVVDDAGNPVPNSGVVLTEGHTPTGGAIPPYPRTDAKGEFEIEVWPNEEYLLYVGADGHGFAKSAPFRPRPGVNVYPPLVIQRANSFLEVVTVDEEGRPVANVDVQFNIPTGYPYHFPTDGRTDRKGRLRVERVVPGAYDVRAGLPDGSRYGMGQARAGETAVRIVVRRSPGGPALPQP
jgi:protocatechuate 3,4-dioxygenase beta subunit